MPTVIFDGYESGPSIKDNVHQRRGYNIHPIISFTSDTKFIEKKKKNSYQEPSTSSS